MPAFYKILLVSFISFLFACNDSSKNTVKTSEPGKKNIPLPADSMTREALFSFIDGCVANSKLTLGEEKAFVFCKCIYDQLRTSYPAMDSVQLIALVNDTAQVAKMASNCR